MKKQMMKGFTLIEIMIVVAIIAILAAVAIPNFVKYQKESMKSTCESNRATIKTAAEAFVMQDASKTPTMADLVKADGTGYLKDEPKCKKGGLYDINKEDSGVIKVTCSDPDHAEAAAETPES